MNIFRTIRLRFFRKKLLQALADQRRSRQIHTIWSARSVSILFDATPDADRREVLDFARALEKDGRKVRLLAYWHDKKSPLETVPFDAFNRKNTTWLGLPKTEKAETFAREKTDLLLLFDCAGRLPLEWVAARSQASMKIGPLTENPNDFDIMLETPIGSDVRFFLQQLDIYLDKIMLPDATAPSSNFKRQSPIAR